MKTLIGGTFDHFFRKGGVLHQKLIELFHHELGTKYSNIRHFFQKKKKKPERQKSVLESSPFLREGGVRR